MLTVDDFVNALTKESKFVISREEIIALFKFADPFTFLTVTKEDLEGNLSDSEASSTKVTPLEEHFDPESTISVKVLQDIFSSSSL